MRIASNHRIITIITAVAAALVCWMLVGCRQPPSNSKPPTKGTAPAVIANNGEIEKAIELARSKVQQSPRLSELRLNLADLHLRHGDTFAAIEQLEIVKKLGAPAGTATRLIQELAARYDSIGETETAEDLLNSLKRDPKLAISVARICLKLGDFYESERAMEPLFSSFRTLTPASQQMVVRTCLLAGDSVAPGKLVSDATMAQPDWSALGGLRALVSGDNTRAAKLLKIAYDSAPDDGWSGYLEARSLLATGRREEALQVLKTVTSRPGAPGPATIALAKLLAEGGDLAGADSLLDQIQGEDRKLPVFWQVSSQIASKRGHQAVANVALGFAYYNEGDPWRAEEIWLSALPGAEDTIARQIYSALSNSAIRRADTDAALRYAEQAIKRWPGNADCNREYAEALLGQNQPEAALSIAQKYQAAVPQDQQYRAAELMCRAALDASRPDLLKINVRMARSLAATEPLPLFHLAEWQANQGRDDANLKQTLALYEEAEKIAPKNAEATAHSGMILASLKRDKEAVDALLKALTLNPRTLDGAPCAVLIQLYRHAGYAEESQVQSDWYRKVRALKDPWPTLLKTLRLGKSVRNGSDWLALGALALRRHETWIALCAFARASELQPSSPEAWRGLAAAQKRLGRFDEALASMVSAFKCTKRGAQ